MSIVAMVNEKYRERVPAWEVRLRATVHARIFHI